MDRSEFRFWYIALTLLIVFVMDGAASVCGMGRKHFGTPVSPALGIQRSESPAHFIRRHHRHPMFRSINGTGNNRADYDMGAAGTQLLRTAPNDYTDGIAALAGPTRLSPREISNLVVTQDHPVLNELHVTDLFWQWGQFLDHDIDLTDGVDPPENADIPVPAGDSYFDPMNTGTAVIPFNRSIYDPATSTGSNNPRQQLNEVTAWIDASNVYGSDDVRAAALRTNDGTGQLRTSSADLLPFNTNSLPNAGGPSPKLFLAGDVRANEQIGLTAMHTLFVREHNRLSKMLAAKHPDWDGDRIYEHARRLVGAEIQCITYREFLPALLGQQVLSRYRGYNRHVNARISNEFSTAAFRFGHSMLSAILLRLDENGDPIPNGGLALREAFFAPERIIDEGGIAPILRGLASHICQRVDVYIIGEVRNFLFGEPGKGGFDLASLNIQRGRDHGLPSYNDLREAYLLGRALTFADISSSPDVQARLASAYASPDDVDLWIGGLAEDHAPHALLGPLFHMIVVDQFEALRDGDRFWYERALSKDDREFVESLHLSDIIRLNTEIGDELQDDVFHLNCSHRHQRKHKKNYIIRSKIEFTRQ